MTDPKTLQLDAGTHWLCTCGQSANYPFCNGSHKATGLQPLALTLPNPAEVEVSGSASASAASGYTLQIK